MKDIIDLILKLKILRGGIPQFLFIAPIDGRSMVRVRDSVLRYKRDNPGVQEIDFILQSPGGSADDAYRIIRTLRNSFKTVNIIVPFWAKSAATLLALGGSQIIMDQFGEFGPLDAQIGKERDDSPGYNSESALNDEHSVGRLETRFKQLFSSLYDHLYKNVRIRIHKQELAKMLLENTSKFYEPLLNQIDPYRLGEKRRFLDVGASYAQRILHQFNGSLLDEQEIASVVDYLVNGCADHGYIIDFDVMNILLDSKIVSKSSVFGSEYEDELSNLSGYFITIGSEIPVVSFIDEEILNDLKGETAEVQEESLAPDKAVAAQSPGIVEKVETEEKKVRKK